MRGVNRSRSSDCMGQAQLITFATDDLLAAAVAAEWLTLIAQAKAEGRRHLVALSGGRVTRKFFSAVVKGAGERGVTLAHVEFFWADERCVPFGDPDSNFLPAQERLFQPLEIRASSVHRIRGELGPEVAAELASAELRGVANQKAPQMPSLDLVLLGMGEDGHVASLFPADLGADGDLDSVYLGIGNSPKPPAERVTLGHGAISAAREAWVLASGSGKEVALRESTAPSGSTPLARVIQHRRTTKVFSDIQL